jgi:hypothetical protein
MNANELKTVVDFEDSLSIGSEVRIYWTNSGRTNTSKAKVVKVNAQSFRVSLLEHVAPSYYGGYPVGTQISIPRLAFGGTGFKLWSANNRLEPINGY